MDKPKLSRIENDRVGVLSLATLEALEKALDTNLDFLRMKSNDPTPKR